MTATDVPTLVCKQSDVGPREMRHGCLVADLGGGNGKIRRNPGRAIVKGGFFMEMAVCESCSSITLSARELSARAFE